SEVDSPEGGSLHIRTYRALRRGLFQHWPQPAAGVWLPGNPLTQKEPEKDGRSQWYGARGHLPRWLRFPISFWIPHSRAGRRWSRCGAVGESEHRSTCGLFPSVHRESNFLWTGSHEEVLRASVHSQFAVIRSGWLRSARKRSRAAPSRCIARTSTYSALAAWRLLRFQYR